MSLRDLEKTAALQTIAYLYRKGLATRRDLRDNIKAAMETVYSALKTLKRLELIEEEETRRFPFTRNAWLNEKGMLIGKRLIEIEEILGTKE